MPFLEIVLPFLDSTSALPALISATVPARYASQSQYFSAI